MFYRLAADAVVVVHMAYVLFVIVGFLLTLAGCVLRWRWIRNPWFRGIHLTMILIVVFEAWMIHPVIDDEAVNAPRAVCLMPNEIGAQAMGAA